MVGNSANIYAADGPRYLAGGAATAADALLVAVLAIIARFVLRAQNRKLAARDAFESGELETQPRNPNTTTPVGFRYIL
ncbi:hypothetical protein Daesc_003658 [Daldinia eschscholtzii]|uniref:Uncharacterized protein n=1 Tax=Daldinia eschscholtzii TaxID=292717 RepID=A0AAX6MV05_9PEZI